MSVASERASLRDRTVGEIAAATPGATEVFRKFKLDFCCGGDIALETAAQKAGIAVVDVEAALNQLADSAAATPLSLATGALIDHILTRYHETHRRELPELIALSRKVEVVHAEHPQVPLGLANLLQEMLGELEVHMKKEELILFPAMRQRAQGRLDAPIAQMRHDHDNHGEQLRKLETLTADFTLPEGACRSWQALYIGAAKVANDVMEHIHLENNVLFPRYEGAPQA